jgi:hypothetical protein
MLQSATRLTMPSWAADALLRLIRISPFIGVALVVFRMVRALQRMQISAGKGARRHLSTASTPGEFWFEMALHLVVAGFLFLMGLLLIGLAPRWLEALMSGD